MRLGLLPLLVPVLAVMAMGQDDEAALKAKYEEKLEKEFVKKVPWLMKLEEAEAKAREQKKLILGYFTRSYAQ